MRKVRTVALLTAFLLLTAPAAAEEVTKMDRYQLWNDCNPILLKHLVSEGAADFGLDENAVEQTARSRLRAARIYDTDTVVPKPVLVVEIKMLPPVRADMGALEKFMAKHGAFVEVRVSLLKPVIDVASREQSFANTWSSYSFNKFDKHSLATASPRLHFTLSKHLDKFIDEYMRVNESDCKW